MKRGNGGGVQICRFILSVLCLILTFIPVLAEAIEPDLEKELQQSLIQSRAIVLQAQQKLNNASSIDDEMTQLKDISESIKINHTLLQERFRLRQEGINSLGVKAQDRHREMEVGYLKALEEYLNLVESLVGAHGDAPANQATIESLKILLDKILPKNKRSIFGSLPYKNLNYPAKEPDASPAIKPAYKGGNKVVSPDDTKDTPEAPLSLEIATLAQSLNWKPVAIYEYVKNNIETEWYWGCMKGAEETLRQKSGNDCDQATLLAALLRASGFPTRYVRGTVEFFAGGSKSDLDKARNLFGIDDPAGIAAFLQKAGIPYRPVIAGGGISNFQVEHIWIETQIPYGNYRGAIIDDSDKTWLGLDTSIKIKWYQYSNPVDITQTANLAGIRDDYLSSLHTETPLEYIKAGIPQTVESYYLTKTLPTLNMKILPDTMQFKQISITHEYTELPDELKHKVRFIASNPQSPTRDPLFDITLDAMHLSNQKIALTYEPETVEDQQIIDSYGGLDNTPAYLVKLRPVLKVNDERVVVGKDGLPMGTDYTLIIELISPNSTERVTNTQITGNLSAIGIVAQKAISSQLSAISEEDDAETLLYKEANRYIDRWNQAEDELASLLHLNITRPIPTVVTVGGVIDVTYLLDMPHGFEWKGVFIDASLRAVSPITHNSSPITASERQKTFMQLSGLQGSILENRIFEDDFEVESISTAKLIQIVGANGGSPILSIDKTNITAVLSASDLDDNIKEDITNAVNQNYIVRIPSADSLALNAISYKDWTGIGYIKENPVTGEAGYMLSGMIAGGMTSQKKTDWVKADMANKLGAPSTKPVNKDPNAVVKVVRIRASDYQNGVVGARYNKPLEVIAFDKDLRPVQNVPITFTVVAGGGKVSSSVSLTLQDSITVQTGSNGIAKAWLKAGEKTADSPIYRQEINFENKTYWELAGLNQVKVTANHPIKGSIPADKPFEAYGRAGAATEMIRLNPMTDIYGPPSSFASSLWVKINDQYGNSISDKNVKFSIKRDYLGTPPSSGAISAKLFGEVIDCPGVATIDCPKAVLADVTPFEKQTEYFGVHPLLIMGNTENTKFTITATAFKDTFDSMGKRIDNKTALNNVAFTFYTKSVDNGYVSVYSPYFIDEKGHKLDAGKVGEKFPQPITAAMFYTERTQEGVFKIMPVVKNPPSGSPFKNDAKMEFQVALGGGGVQPVYYYEADAELLLKFEPSVTQTMDNSLSKGTYEANVKLGDAPGKNRINAIGTVTASVPSYDAQGNGTWTDKALSAYYPIELWGVKLTVPSYQQLVLNSEGYPVADVEFQYSIEPSNYQYTPANVGLEIFERSAAGSEVLMGFVAADSNKKIILSKGMAKFDSNNTYYAQVVLNRGQREVRSEKIPLINAALIPDYDRNGVIDDRDRERTQAGDIFYFWINDDDDGGETDGSDIPEDKLLTSFNLDYESAKVDGIRDLIDFFPVHLDIRDVLRSFDPKKYAYLLKSVDASMNFVFTDLTTQHSGYYLTGDNSNLDIPITLGNADTYPITTIGTQLLDTYSSPTFLDKILLNKSRGIILLEGKKASSSPLELVVLDANQITVFSMKLNLSLDGVEQMFRHKNLTPVVYTEVAPGPGSKAGEEDRFINTGKQPLNFPDMECTGNEDGSGKNFVFLHGYNVNGQEARGWHSEMFKRMFWSGSKAKFWGVTWDGWDTQEIPYLGSLPFTRNYHINVEHAFDTAPALREFLLNKVSGEITIAGHSLGNMVISATLTDVNNVNAGGWDANGKIKSYFMMDAAVAAEAYGFADDGIYTDETVKKGVSDNMTHPEWKDYNKRLWASEWHLLFKGASPIDNRELLTWRNIFAKRPASVNYYNFFSQGEEVLDEHKGELQVSDLIKQFKQTGIYTWALQEKLKGKAPVDGILGSDYGGWGFNNEWDVFDVDIMDVRRRTPSEAAGIGSLELRTMPFFLKGNEADLYKEEIGSNYAAQNKIRLLADAIPARTLAAGKDAVSDLGTINEFNFDIQTTYKTTKKVNGKDVVYWPRGGLFQRDNWRHGDAREVAYSYVYLLFDKFVSLGGLK